MKGIANAAQTHLPADPAAQILNDQLVVRPLGRPVLVHPGGTAFPSAPSRGCAVTPIAAAAAKAILIPAVRGAPRELDAYPNEKSGWVS